MQVAIYWNNVINAGGECLSCSDTFIDNQMVSANMGFLFGQEDNGEKKEEEKVEEEKWEENFKEHHDSRPRGKI